MSKLFAIISRLGAMAYVAAVVGAYYAKSLEWAHRSLWYAHYFWLDISIAAATGVLACVVVFLLNQRNAGRVITISVLATICAWIGVAILSDPMTWGSYDHGGETVHNALFYGPLGVIVGYFIACVLLANRSRN
jgi:hypothetical protein